MSVRAKMRVTGRHELTGCGKEPKIEQVIVTLQPVYDDGSGPNKEWSQWTPSGEVRMTITNPAAYAQFVLGKDYFVDFVAAAE